jgi:hypothetical protein
MGIAKSRQRKKHAKWMIIPRQNRVERSDYCGCRAHFVKEAIV